MTRKLHVCVRVCVCVHGMGYVYVCVCVSGQISMCNIIYFIYLFLGFPEELGLSHEGIAPGP